MLDASGMPAGVLCSLGGRLETILAKGAARDCLSNDIPSVKSKPLLQVRDLQSKKTHELHCFQSFKIWWFISSVELNCLLFVRGLHSAIAVAKHC